MTNRVCYDASSPADGYLLDQFTQKSANNRTDEYGGSKENRARMILETIQAVADAIGEDKVAIRLSPYSNFQGMNNDDNVEVFTYLCQQIRERFPKFAYVHMVESRGDPAKLANWATAAGDASDAETLEPFRKIFEGSETVFMSAGGYTADIAREVIKVHGGAVVFGRMFISSESRCGKPRWMGLTPRPRLAIQAEAQGGACPIRPVSSPSDRCVGAVLTGRSTFYTTDAKGYTTYPSSQPATRAASPAAA